MLSELRGHLFSDLKLGGLRVTYGSRGEGGRALNHSGMDRMGARWQKKFHQPHEGPISNRGLDESDLEIQVARGNCEWRRGI